MPHFLTRAEVYRLLQRELPDNVYPDGAPDAFYSTAEQDSVADVIATGYANAERIYANYWPKTADERIADWEITAFGKKLREGLSLDERRDRVAVKIRSRKGLTRSDMVAVVQSIIGSDKSVEVAGWGRPEGGWIIGVSELGISTILNGARMLDATGSAICEADPADFGKTADDWVVMQQQAYTYSVLIYGYTLTADEAIDVEAALLDAEPARDRHVIYDGLNISNRIDGAT
jgi:hypothetical protein